MATAFLSTSNSLFQSSLSPSTSSCSSSSSSLVPALIYLNNQNVQRRRTLCKALNESPVLNKRGFTLCFITRLVLDAGNGCSNAIAEILEADDDEEFLEKVKKDRQKRPERQGVISSSTKEKEYLQDLVYKPLTTMTYLQLLQFLGEPLIHSGSIFKNANVAFNKLSSSPEETMQVETFKSS